MAKTIRLGKYDEEAHNVYREMPEYQEGVNAFRSCFGHDDCDYEQGTDARMAWLCGWYDSNTNDRVGHILKRYGHSYP